jgi:hypothetical protein
MLFQERVTMTSAKWFGGILLAIAAGLAPQLAAQLQTDVPPPVAGAKPVTVEHIKVHGVVEKNDGPEPERPDRLGPPPIGIVMLKEPFRPPEPPPISCRPSGSIHLYDTRRLAA